MNAEFLTFIGLVGVANILAWVWGASRMSSTIDRLDETLKEVVRSLAAEAQANAVQNERLDTHDDRLKNHDRLLARRLRFEGDEQ